VISGTLPADGTFAARSPRGNSAFPLGSSNENYLIGAVTGTALNAYPRVSATHRSNKYRCNQGTNKRTLQAYLGHRNVQHTVRYTELSPTRFKNLWRD
jgi:type 1 fimbriae regulatory protein FimB/type 1 fimbriae regulatory protein FimE